MRIKANQKIFFCTNTKMAKNLQQSVEYLQELEILTRDLKDKIDLVVIPPYTALYTVQKLAHGYITIGAQNVCRSEETENTGEISAGMLRELEIPIVMIGHSERRRSFGETDEDIALKAKCLTEKGMSVLLGIGETLKQKENGESEEILNHQIKTALKNVETENYGLIRVLYEPAWAIGTAGKVTDPDYVGRIHTAIRESLIQIMGEELGNVVPILYGGSVNEQNALSIFRQPNVDGLGIGRSAWNAAMFNKIIRNVLAFNEKYWEGEKNYAENIK